MNKYAVLVGNSEGFTIPLIEVRNWRQLCKQLIQDLELLVNYGDEPWWSPTSMAVHLNEPKSYAFGDVIGSAGSFEVKIVPYNSRVSEVDLLRCSGSFYCHKTMDENGFPLWIVVQNTDGGWYFLPDSPLLTKGQIAGVCTQAHESDSEYCFARPFGARAISMRRAKSWTDGIGYNANVFLG